MATLWSPERLISLCSHNDRDVRRWAADKLRRHYPEEAATTLALLLNDSDQMVTGQAAAYFCDHPHKEYADELLSALKRSSGRVAGRLSRAAGSLGDTRLLDVVREKYSSEPIEDIMGFALVLPGIALLRTDMAQTYVEESLPRLLSSPYMESLSGSFFAANLMAGTDIERLLRFCIQNRAKETLPSLLFEVLSKCGSWILREELTEKPAKGGSRKELPLMVQDSLNLSTRWDMRVPRKS